MRQACEVSRKGGRKGARERGSEAELLHSHYACLYFRASVHPSFVPHAALCCARGAFTIPPETVHGKAEMLNRTQHSSDIAVQKAKGFAKGFVKRGEHVEPGCSPTSCAVRSRARDGQLS